MGRKEQVHQETIPAEAPNVNRCAAFSLQDHVGPEDHVGHEDLVGPGDLILIFIGSELDLCL